MTGADLLTCDERRERHRQQQRRTPETQTIHGLHPRFLFTRARSGLLATPLLFPVTLTSHDFLHSGLILHSAARGTAASSLSPAGKKTQRWDKSAVKGRGCNPLRLRPTPGYKPIRARASRQNTRTHTWTGFMYKELLPMQKKIASPRDHLQVNNL